MALLEAAGEVRHVSKRVNARFEVSAITKRADPGPALVFDHVDDYTMPVVMGVDGTRSRIARSLGTTPAEFTEKYVGALRDPLACVSVDSGPVKEVVQLGDEVDLLRDLPILTHYEKDGGPYITTGLVVAQDPTGSVRNVSYHRMQVTGPREIHVLLLPRHLRRLFEEAEAADRELPIAIVVGCDSAQRLAAATWGSSIPLGMDEFSISGALKGTPEELVKCETSDVMVPATAEIVIEGVLLPGVREKEGRFAEYTGNYGGETQSPVIRVDAVTRRSDAIYQGLLAFTTEHHHLLGIPYEPVLLEAVRRVLPDTKVVHVTAGGCGKFHVVVQIHKRHECDGRDAVFAALSGIRDIKLVTVVDEDVDPFDAKDVEWAMATRFQADRDLIVVERSWGNQLDPSNNGGRVTSKMGVDATRPLDAGDRYFKAEVPGVADVDLAELLGQL